VQQAPTDVDASPSLDEIVAICNDFCSDAAAAALMALRLGKAL
jgi:hypothetical protein